MFINYLTSIVFCCMLSFATADLRNSNGADYFNLISEIQQWHETNPNSCGRDTPTCGAQQLVNGFGGCSDDFRIVNGCKSEHADVGWTVGAVTGPMLCTGTLLSPRHVALAAHCVDGITTRAIVYIGNRSLRNASLTTEQKYFSQSFAMHPAYNRLAAANDSAIIKLDRDVVFGSTGARPACLPTSKAPRTLTNCLAAGYGINNNDPNAKDDGAGRLRYTVLSVVKDSRCYKAYGDGLYGYYPSLSFCGIGKHINNGSDTCSGDSGAGFVCKDAGGRWTLYGIVSYGPPQCGSVPSVYADAYALGIRNPTNIRRKDAGDICKGNFDINTNNNGDATSGFGPSFNPPSPTPPSSTDGGSLSSSAGSGNPNFDQIFGPPQFSGFGAGASSARDAKKPGGLFTTIAETIKNSGCSSANQCTTSICKPISLCNSSASSKFRLLTPNVLPENGDKDFNAMPRPAKPVKVEEERRSSFTPRMCRTASVCWPSAWSKAFSTAMPMFEFNS